MLKIQYVIGTLAFLLCSLILIKERNYFNETEKRDTCERSVKVGEVGQFELVILTSCPGSGNTWTRLLLENASGFYTGKVLCVESV